MKKLCLLLVLCVVSGACRMSPPSSSAGPRATTGFFDNFSMSETATRAGGPQVQAPGMHSTGASGGASDASRFRKASTLDCRLALAEGEAFSEEEFLRRLSREIEAQIEAAGGRVYQRGEGDAAFYLDYQDGGIRGAIEVNGARLEGNVYRLRYVIRETGGE